MQQPTACAARLGASTAAHRGLRRWDDHAAALSEDDARRRPVLSVRSVRVGDYGGCSLSTGRSSIVEVDAKIKEAEELRYPTRPSAAPAWAF